MLNKRKFFQGLAAVVTFVAFPFKARAEPQYLPGWDPNDPPEWYKSYLKFLATPYSERLDFENMFGDQSGNPDWGPALIKRIKNEAEKHARAQGSECIPFRVHWDKFEYRYSPDGRITRINVTLRQHIKAAIEQHRHPVVVTGAPQG